MSKMSKSESRRRRHFRIRKKIRGTVSRPRLAVFRSNTNIYAQVIDDKMGHTLVSASSLEKEFRTKFGGKLNIEVAKAIGTAIGQRAKDKGITSIVFDRGGYIYHGKIKALADAVREAGLDF